VDVLGRRLAAGDLAAVDVAAARPRIVAHRGASAAEAEHTLAAYTRAIDDGADGLECDVRLTRDGHLVCVHDRTVDRTSSGSGVLSTLELADLEELDFGSWKATGAGGEGEEAADRDRSRVLTLRRLLSVVAGCDRQLELAIETKHPTRYAGLVEERLADTLGEAGLAASEAVRVMSFSALSLRRMQARAPALGRVYLMYRRIPARYRGGALPRGVGAAGPSLELLRRDPGYVERVHACGGQVHVWVANEPEDVAFVTGLGVDVIITDRPGEALKQLGR
jgi:glycerophosphoryl diester phosphodiesterase